MDDVKTYSKEWMISHCSKEQLKDIEKASKKAKKNDNNTVLKESVFVGSVEEVKKRVENGSRLNFSQKEAIKKIGVDNLLKLMDVDGDGNITREEIKDVAYVDNDEFDDKSIAILTTNDIKTIYENALKSKDGKVESDGAKTTYTFKDGSSTIVLKDENGQILSKQDVSPITRDEQTISTHIYETQTKEFTKIDLKTKSSVTTIDAPGELNDKTVKFNYNSDGTKTVTTETIGKVVTTQYNSDGYTLNNRVDLKFNSDKAIGDFNQKGYGDCWFLASLKSLSDTEIGRKLIQDCIIHKPNGDISVQLKGVKVSYVFTPEEVVKMINDGKKQGKEYSQGDIDVNLFEFAVQKYRKSQGSDLDDGTVMDGFKILTGQNATVSVFGLAEPFMLNGKQKNPEKYALMAAFEGSEPSVDSMIFSNHAYSVSRVTKDTVYVINPWDSSREIAYPKDKFKKNCIALSSINLEKIK